jgi:hypothetical protein
MHFRKKTLFDMQMITNVGKKIQKGIADYPFKPAF